MSYAPSFSQKAMIEEIAQVDAAEYWHYLN